MTTKEKQFLDIVWDFYKVHKRSDLPWRQTRDPYKILVSEIMLQQTQVVRVLPKYHEFLQQWGTITDLAQAPLGSVLVAWQGLGYNRRAKLLWQCAQEIVCDYRGVFPDSYDTLQTLSGVGPYTAGALMAFAFNKPVPIIETNIRTVYLHHFFTGQTAVSEAAITQLVEQTLDHSNPREWYWALMDYGSHLKNIHGNPNKRAKNYVKQSAFEGSNRQVRGAIIRTLTLGSATKSKLQQILSQLDTEQITIQLKLLEEEGLIIKDKQSYALPE